MELPRWIPIFQIKFNCFRYMSISYHLGYPADIVQNLIIFTENLQLCQPTALLIRNLVISRN